ncbi:MAG: polysaccharide biosynthesis/export family protein [Paraburkholderia sp.]|uniref:polysaccharide biosynthesis/export family protein n=1 Tax=Paraburkholderia sp. TaxID=1926495 RepID=UPI003C4B3345
MKTRTLLACLAITSLCACSVAPGPYLDTDRLDQTAQPTVAQMKYTVKPIDITYFAEERAKVVPATCPLTCFDRTTRADYDYKAGINDQLTIIVWDHPELTSGGSGGAGATPLPSSAQGNTGTAAGGAAMAAGAASAEGGLVVRVANDGTIFFPRVGRIKVVGLDAQHIQKLLTSGLAKTIRDPQLDVRISGFNSQSVQATGNVRTPAAESITDVPLTILDAINRAGGALPDADLQNVGVTRNGKRYTVDVASLLETGDQQQNVLLQDGDIIDVPDRSNSRVFVLGEVGRPISLPMNRGRLTLADAITGASGLDPKSSDPHMIYVIRGADKTLSPEVFKLDMTQVDAVLLMTKFELQPKDVVYVQVANSARFNRLLDTITPALNTLFFYKAFNN